MRIFIPLIAVLALVLFLPGCATMTLQENIRRSERASSTRISARGISDGVCEVKMEYLGESNSSGDHASIYAATIESMPLKLVIQHNQQFDFITLTDHEFQISSREQRNPLIVDLAKIAPPEVVLGDLTGTSPRIFVQVFDSKERVRSISDGTVYDFLSGVAYTIDGGRVKTSNFRQDLTLENSVKIWNTVKSSGYIITVPFDVVTSPIQGVFLLYEISKIQVGPGG